MFFFYNVLKKLRQLCAEVFFRNLTKVSLQMREGQAECMKKLVSQTITLPAFFIKLPVSVFTVSHKGISPGGQMRPDLMSSSCNQSYLQKCCPSIAAKRCVHSLYRLGILNFIFIYSNLVASGVFF